MHPFGFKINCVKAQQVVIVNTNPSQELEVTVNVKSATVKPAALKVVPNAGAGKILTNAATGNASWADVKTGGKITA